MGDIHYNPWQDKSLAGMTKRTLGWAFGKKKKLNDLEQSKRSEDIQIAIYKNDKELNGPNNSKTKAKEREILAQGQGNWLSHISFDGEITWRIEEEIPLWLERGDRMSDGSIILPSDTDLRDDVPLMEAKNWQVAEHIKNKMETLQRNDAKMRKAAVAKK